MSVSEHPDVETLMAWTDAELEDPMSTRVRAHVAICPTCQEAVGSLNDLSGRLRTWHVEPAPFSRPAQSPPLLGKIGWLIAASIVVALASLVTWRLVAFRPSPAAEHSSASTSFDASWAARPRVNLQTTSSAAVTLVAFMDWQCPPCLTGYPTYRDIVTEYNAAGPGRLALVLKDYPLDPKCNPNVKMNHHPSACDAAAAVRLARDRGREQDLIDRLLVTPPEARTPEGVRVMTASVLGPVDFEAEYARYRPHIEAEIKEGTSLRIQFTPTLFVNGVQLEDISPTGVRQAIDAELKRLGRQGRLRGAAVRAAERSKSACWSPRALGSGVSGPRGPRA